MDNKHCIQEMEKKNNKNIVILNDGHPIYFK